MSEIEIPREAWEMANRPYTITVTEDADNGYVARVEEFPWLVVAEDTREELDASVRKMIALNIAADMLKGRQIPEPHRVTA